MKTLFKLARSSVRYESLKCACDWILEGPYTRLLGKGVLVVGVVSVMSCL